jgi:hypothetical protein
MNHKNHSSDNSSKSHTNNILLTVCFSILRQVPAVFGCVELALLDFSLQTDGVSYSKSCKYDTLFPVRKLKHTVNNVSSLRDFCTAIKSTTLFYSLRQAASFDKFHKKGLLHHINFSPIR